MLCSRLLRLRILGSCATADDAESSQLQPGRNAPCHAFFDGAFPARLGVEGFLSFQLAADESCAEVGREMRISRGSPCLYLFERGASY